MSLRITIFAAIPLVAGLVIGWGVAQSQPSRGDSPLKYKMTTEAPPGIASPNEVQTRLGKLKFFDGVPDQASAEKIYDNLDFQRAVQAYLLGLPIVNRSAIGTTSSRWAPPTPPCPSGTIL